jgi:GNAT superfamily N-acetyltransferase
VEITSADTAEVEDLVDLICARTPDAARSDVAWMWASPEECPDLQTLVARDDDGTLLGLGRITSPVLLPPTWAVVNATVSRAAEGRGAGGALFRGLLERRRDGIEQLRVTVDATDERALAIARHWGFEDVQTSIESMLDLSDPGRLPAPDPGDGVTLEDVSSYEFADRGAVEAMLLASQTHPEAQQGVVSTLDDLALNTRTAPVAVLARVGGVPAGIVAGAVEEGVLFIAYTGVDPRFRGHGLARLLKQRAHLDGAALGATSTRTNNAEHNGGIRRVNRELGYEVVRSLVRMRRVL